MLNGFRGDIDWIHEREGHKGRPYWPGGVSGVTLDPGVDLGQVDHAFVCNAYASILSIKSLAALSAVMGLRGLAAKNALQGPSRNIGVCGIRITKNQAKSLLPGLLDRYWRKLVVRFPSTHSAPPHVQTALLSLVYNRGPNNKKLSVMEESIRNHDWAALSDIVSDMQQDHPLQGIRDRRKLEGALIAGKG